MDNARDLERYSSIGADIRQVESVIAELERHRRVLSTHVTELRDLLETMEAVTRLVRAVARCSGSSTIGGGGRSVFLTSASHRPIAPARRRCSAHSR
jgi:hypothetical protein